MHFKKKVLVSIRKKYALNKNKKIIEQHRKDIDKSLRNNRTISNLTCTNHISVSHNILNKYRISSNPTCIDI